MDFTTPRDSNDLLPKKQLLNIRDRIVKTFKVANWREVAIITNFEEITAHPRLLRSLSFGDDDYGGCVLDILDRIYTSSPRVIFEIQEYLDAKFPDSADGENVSSEITKGRKIVFNPLVFQVPDGAPGNTSFQVSVMIPFSMEFEKVFQAIVKGANGVTCLRASDIWEHSTVIQDIFSLIFRSAAVVCDFTGKNPNVFYEAGIAHTLGKYVIPITQNADDIPFDLSHHRYLRYLNNEEGLSELSAGISERLWALNIPF